MLWEEYRGYDWLMAERDRLISEGDVAYFYQEYQNIPMDDSFRVLKEDMQYWDGIYSYQHNQSFLTIDEDGEKEQIPVNIFMGVDPAASENVKADYTVIMVIAVDEANNIYVVDYFRGQVTPMACADKLFEMMEFYNPREVKIEETGHIMLSEYVIQKSKQEGHFYNINPKKAIKSKYYRIKQMQPYFASKALFLKDSHWELESELLNFKEHGTFKKDTLDALRWALDDVFVPRPNYDEDGNLLEYRAQVVGMDWQTGQLIYA